MKMLAAVSAWHTIELPISPLTIPAFVSWRIVPLIIQRLLSFTVCGLYLLRSRSEVSPPDSPDKSWGAWTSISSFIPHPQEHNYRNG